jgi:F-type H+-transporting ATPase subunit delta
MLRGASAEARTELASRLGSSATLEETATLGEQLLAVAGVLRSEAALRRVFTDASIEGEAKAGLAANVFSGKVGDKTLDLVKAAVQQRWTSSRDLAAVLEELGISALVRSAGAQGPRVSDELFAVAQLIDANPDLRGALSDPARSEEDKAGLLDSVLEGKVLPATLRLVTHAVRSDGPVGNALAHAQRVAADVQHELLAVVHTAQPLGTTEITRLTRALGKAYSTTVHLHVVEDPSLIGGLRVEIGDDVIDGSVATRLSDLRLQLVG